MAKLKASLKETFASEGIKVRNAGIYRFVKVDDRFENIDAIPSSDWKPGTDMAELQSFDGANGKTYRLAIPCDDGSNLAINVRTGVPAKDKYTVGLFEAISDRNWEVGGRKGTIKQGDKTHLAY